MERRLEWLSFEDWVAHVFDHDVRQPQWYFDLDASFWDAPASLSLEYMTRLFRDPARHLASYTDAQLNQGFWYLVSNAGSNHMFALTDPSAPESARVACVQSFLELFEKLFAVRCSDHLEHLSPPGANELNLACYMWWDLIPLFGSAQDPSRRAIDAAALEVMERTLVLPSNACRENALHGLGHWKVCYPERVEEIIADALSRADDWSPELVAYARNARTGCVL